MIKNILIIGLGNIGYRHFQALNSSRYNIYLIDPKISKFKLTKFYKEIKGKKIYFIKNYNKLPSKINLAIISCSSNMRFQCTKKLLDNTKVDHIILEKILFDKLSNYKKINIFKKYKTYIGVNTIHRCSSNSRFILKRNGKNKIRKIIVHGNNWGLACNYIHFIDLINFFINEKKYKIVSHKFSNIYNSKRQGFIDFYGCVNLLGEKGTKIKFANNNGKKSLKTEIYTDKYIYKINYLTKKFSEVNLKNKQVMKLNFEDVQVSELTNTLTKQLFNKNKCNLPNLKTSSEMHLPLFKLFCKKYAFYKSLTNRGYCPIT